MPQLPLSITGDIHFKLRFNTAHGETDFYWRVIIPAAGAGAESGERQEQEYLVRSIHYQVPTWSESSFDKRANAIKFHIAGRCTTFHINEQAAAEFF